MEIEYLNDTGRTKILYYGVTLANMQKVEPGKMVKVNFHLPKGARIYVKQWSNAIFLSWIHDDVDMDDVSEMGDVSEEHF